MLLQIIKKIYDENGFDKSLNIIYKSASIIRSKKAISIFKLQKEINRIYLLIDKNEITGTCVSVALYVTYKFLCANKFPTILMGGIFKDNKLYGHMWVRYKKYCFDLKKNINAFPVIKKIELKEYFSKICDKNG